MLIFEMFATYLCDDLGYLVENNESETVKSSFSQKSRFRNSVVKIKAMIVAQSAYILARGFSRIVNVREAVN